MSPEGGTQAGSSMQVLRAPDPEKEPFGFVPGTWGDFPDMERKILRG